jgi:hypothetical protein
MRPPDFGVNEALDDEAYEPPESAMEQRARGATATVSTAFSPARTGEVTRSLRTPFSMAWAPPTARSATSPSKITGLVTRRMVRAYGDDRNAESWFADPLQPLTQRGMRYVPVRT